MYVCLCHGISDRQIRAAVTEHGGSLSEISNALGVATGCGQCREHAESVIAECQVTRCRRRMSQRGLALSA